MLLTLHYLFNIDSEFTPNETLIKGLRIELNFSGDFHHLTNQWWKFIPFTYRLQQWNMRRNMKHFKVFPIFKHKRHHVTYDGQAFQQLLRTWKISPNKYPAFQVKEDERWRKYFKIEDVETNGNPNIPGDGHKFFGSIA